MYIIRAIAKLLSQIIKFMHGEKIAAGVNIKIDLQYFQITEITSIELGVSLDRIYCKATKLYYEPKESVELRYNNKLYIPNGEVRCHDRDYEMVMRKAKVLGNGDKTYTIIIDDDFMG